MNSKKAISTVFRILVVPVICLVAILPVSSCQSATRLVTLSSDGTYQIRYIDSKSPINVDVMPQTNSYREP